MASLKASITLSLGSMALNALLTDLVDLLMWVLEAIVDSSEPARELSVVEVGPLTNHSPWSEHPFGMLCRTPLDVATRRVAGEMAADYFSLDSPLTGSRLWPRHSINVSSFPFCCSAWVGDSTADNVDVCIVIGM
jgi:hypothetical protein